MRHAIVTRYRPPTTMTEGRIRVTGQLGSLTVPVDDDDEDEDSNHERAATAYALNHNWLGPEHDRHSRLVGGILPDDSRVFVLVPIERTLTLSVTAAQTLVAIAPQLASAGGATTDLGPDDTVGDRAAALAALAALRQAIDKVQIAEIKARGLQTVVADLGIDDDLTG